MKTLGVRWTGLWVRDLEGCAAFYRDFLGMAELGSGPGFVRLDAGNGVALNIFAATQDAPDERGRPQQHTWEVSFAVDDVDEAIDELASKGAYPSPKHIGRFADERWIAFRDPEGNLTSLKEQRPQRLPSKAELLEKLRASEREALDRLRAVPPERFQQVVTSEGWTGQRALASIAAVERTPSRLVDIARERLAGAPERPPRGTGDDYMRRQLAIRAEAPIEGLIEEFQTNRAASIAAVEQASDALLAGPSPGGFNGALGIVIYALAVELMLGYVGEITGIDYLPWRLRRVPS